MPFNIIFFYFTSFWILLLQGDNFKLEYSDWFGFVDVLLLYKYSGCHPCESFDFLDFEHPVGLILAIRLRWIFGNF